MGVGAIALVAVWLAGPSASGVAARRGLAPYLARPEIAFGVAGSLFLLLLWWSPTVQTTRVPLMVAGAIVLAVGVELLRRQTAREVPAPPPPDLSGSVRGRGPGAGAHGRRQPARRARAPGPAARAGPADG